MPLQSVMGSLSPCSVEALLPYPTLVGAEFLSVSASLVTNFNQDVWEGAFPNHGSTQAINVTFCNVTVTHTHPGQHDRVNTQVWLPMPWNERLQGIGGGGWAAGMYPLSDMGMAGAIAEGYASVSTNGGVGLSPNEWALLSPGNVNLYALQDFSSVALNDAAVIAKALCKRFYGREPRYSYWTGCSQGGRQGYMLAQRYPNAYDGIAAGAPAINTPALVTSDYFPQQVMNEMGEYPRPCELDALTNAAISACDADDGIVDGIITDPDSCEFNPFDLVGEVISCPDARDSAVKISTAAAVTAQAAWTGAKDELERRLWYGLGPAANLTGNRSIAITSCSDTGDCKGVPQSLVTDWIRLFVYKDANASFTNLTRREYAEMVLASAREYDSIIGTNFPDVSAFRDAGGKLLSFHGLADEIIPSEGTRSYYAHTFFADDSAHNYYRLFESPGLAHCYGGAGAYPYSAFDALVQWVENGKAPERLHAHSVPDENGNRIQRILCPWPMIAVFEGKEGQENDFDAWSCSVDDAGLAFS